MSVQITQKTIVQRSVLWQCIDEFWQTAMTPPGILMVKMARPIKEMSIPVFILPLGATIWIKDSIKTSHDAAFNTSPAQ